MTHFHHEIIVLGLILAVAFHGQVVVLLMQRRAHGNKETVRGRTLCYCFGRKRMVWSPNSVQLSPLEPVGNLCA
jgi:hypothetical protein